MKRKIGLVFFFLLVVHKVHFLQLTQHLGALQSQLSETPAGGLNHPTRGNPASPKGKSRKTQKKLVMRLLAAVARSRRSEGAGRHNKNDQPVTGAPKDASRALSAVETVKKTTTIAQLVAAILITIIFFSFMGYCTTTITDHLASPCSGFGWFAAAMLAWIGIKNLYAKSQELGSPGTTTGKRNRRLSGEEKQRRYLRVLHTPLGMSSIFNAASKILKDADFSEVDETKPDSLIEFVGKFLQDKFPPARDGIKDTIQRIRPILLSRAANFIPK